MQRETQLELIARFQKMRADRTTQLADEVVRRDVAVYLDEDRARREREVLFRGRPLVAAVSGHLPDTGSYAAVDVGDVPILLIRGEDGQVRAFLNACRHRGSRLAEGCGTPGRVLSCRYHAWTYDLDGQLLGQPLARGGFDGVDTASTGLLEVPCTEAHGLIVVAPGASAPPDVEEWLGGLAPELDDWEFDTWHRFDSTVMEVECNWKLAYDTYLESYHIFSLHDRTVGQYVLPTPFTSDDHGQHSRGVLFGKQLAKHLASTPEEEWSLVGNGGFVYLLFPNVVLNMPQSGHLELWQLYPHRSDPRRCEVHLTLYVPEPVTTEKAERFWRKNFDFTRTVIFEEDFLQQQDIQRNIETGLYPEVLHGRNEPGLQRWHRLLDEALSQA